MKTTGLNKFGWPSAYNVSDPTPIQPGLLETTAQVRSSCGSLPYLILRVRHLPAVHQSMASCLTFSVCRTSTFMTIISFSNIVVAHFEGPIKVSPSIIGQEAVNCLALILYIGSPTAHQIGWRAGLASWFFWFSLAG